MPLPPDHHARHASNPARVMLNSPLAAAMRARVYHQRTRTRPPERGLRLLAMVGTLLVHLLFLLAFVLGPAYPLQPPAPARRQVLQVRLIEAAPRPPARGRPPRERGPVHQGRGQRVAVVSRRPAHTATPSVAAAPLAPTAMALASPPAKAALPAPRPAMPPRAASPPAAARPQVPPAPPRPVAAPPRPAPSAPPRSQPEAVRKPQAEGNRPMLPPTSLLLPKLALPAAPIALPQVAPAVAPPTGVAPLSIVPAPVSPAPSPAPNPPPLPMAPVAIAAPVLPQPTVSVPSLGKLALVAAP
ncbi:MAG: hypothetical protein KGJ96_08330, partial [Xanthomonadaceae bacterium]|nr:hypothetical protein [Xanthomonadaceae bacterium]